MSTTLPLTIGRPKSGAGRPGTSGGVSIPPVPTAAAASASEEKYREVIVRLKKLLDMERESLKQVCVRAGDVLRCGKNVSWLVS